MLRRFAAALVAVTLLLSSARAETPQKPPQTWNLRYQPGEDFFITLLGLSVFAGSKLVEPQLRPDGCRWCETNALDRAVRDALRSSDPDYANELSNLTAYVLGPASALGVMLIGAHGEGRANNFPIDALVVTEAVVLAGAMNRLFVFSFGRERPFVHALPEDQKPLTSNPNANNLSFYSGHTSFAFSLAVAGGTVASMRRYRFAKLMWVGGLAGATATGFLRMAADKHWFTDVLTGATMGSAIGFAVPYLLHRPKPIHATVIPTPGGGAQVSVGFRF